MAESNGCVKTLTMGVTQAQLDFVDKLKKEHGVPHWHVVSDALDFFMLHYNEEGDKVLDMLETSRIHKRVEKRAEAARVKAQRDADKAAKAAAAEADAAERVKPMTDELSAISGVNASQAKGLAETFKSWSKIAKASDDELTAVGIKKAAANRVRKHAEEKAAEEKAELSKKRSEAGATRHEISKELTQFNAETAATVLGVTKRALKKMLDAEELMTADDDGDVILLPSNIEEIPEAERVDAAKSVVK